MTCLDNALLMRLAADVRLVGLLAGHGEGADLTAYRYSLTHTPERGLVVTVSQ